MVRGFARRHQHGIEERDESQQHGQSRASDRGDQPVAQTQAPKNDADQAGPDHQRCAYIGSQQTRGHQFENHHHRAAQEHHEFERKGKFCAITVT